MFCSSLWLVGNASGAVGRALFERERNITTERQRRRKTQRSTMACIQSCRTAPRQMPSHLRSNENNGLFSGTHEPRILSSENKGGNLGRVVDVFSCSGPRSRFIREGMAYGELGAAS